MVPISNDYKSCMKLDSSCTTYCLNVANKRTDKASDYRNIAFEVKLHLNSEKDEYRKEQTQERQFVL